MDKKQLIGLVLIFALFLVWSMMNNKSRKAMEEQQRIEDSISMTQNPAIEQPTTTNKALAEESPEIQVPVTSPDSLQDAKLAYQFGVFAESGSGTEKEYELENDLFKITFTSKGGAIKKVLLKDHYKLERQPDNSEKKVELYLLEDDKNKFRYEIPFQGVPGNMIRSDELFYQVNQKNNSITFRANAGQGAYFEQTYTIKPDKYDIDYTINLVGLDRQIDSGSEGIKLNWINYLDKLERNYKFEKFYSTVYYKEVDEDSDYCNCRKDDEDDVSDTKLDWVSNANQFFNTALIATSKPFDGAVLKTEMMDEDNSDLKKLTSDITIPYTASSNFEFDMTLYMGPNDFNTLRGYEIGLEEVIPYGRSIFGTINRWVVRPVFNYLDNFFHSKGLAIIVMIFLVKVLLYPLTYKMLYSQAKMGALKPEMEKNKEKFKEEPQQLQVANMKLYREYGVSPLGGCMPMIIQMPIWYALFRFFPASIDFRQESFLWATDLSSYDVLTYLPFEIPAYGAHISLFTILWAISTVAYTYYNTRHMDMSANPAMKYVQYFMPIMFLFFFNNYASGLTCYMFFSNIFNVGQTLGTKKFVFSNEKIRAELMKNKEKPKKQSKFQARLQDAMKQQQAVQDKKKKSKKK